MKKHPFILSALAINDLQEINDFYIDVQDPEFAQEVSKKIIKTIEKITLYPFLGRQGGEQGTREKMVKNTPYVVIYAVEEDNIFILRIYHTSRKWFD